VTVIKTPMLCRKPDSSFCCQWSRSEKWGKFYQLPPIQIWTEK